MCRWTSGTQSKCLGTERTVICSWTTTSKWTGRPTGHSLSSPSRLTCSSEGTGTSTKSPNRPPLRGHSRAAFKRQAGFEPLADTLYVYTMIRCRASCEIITGWAEKCEMVKYILDLRETISLFLHTGYA